MPAAFENPKVAAHGDYAITAAMQLAKPSRPIRALGNNCGRTAGRTAVQQWVQDIDIAGPGFINLRLKPAAKQQVVQEVLAQGARFGNLASAGNGCWWNSSSQPPALCMSDMAARLRWATPSATCFATQGWDVYREFYYNDAGVQINHPGHQYAASAQGVKPGMPNGRKRPTTVTTSRTLPTTSWHEKTVQADDRSFTASGDVNDLDSIRNFAVAYLRHEQDKDLQAFNLKFDNYYLESSLYTSGRVEGHGGQAAGGGQDLRARWRVVAQEHRVWRRQRTASCASKMAATPTSCPMWPTTSQRGAWLHQGDQHPGHRPPRHHRARVRAGLQAAGVGIPQGYPDYVLHTMVRVVKGR